MKFVKAYFGKLNLKLNCFQLVNVEHCTCKFGIVLVLGEAYDQKCLNFATHIFGQYLNSSLTDCTRIINWPMTEICCVFSLLSLCLLFSALVAIVVYKFKGQGNKTPECTLRGMCVGSRNWKTNRGFTAKFKG